MKSPFRNWFTHGAGTFLKTTFLCAFVTFQLRAQESKYYFFRPVSYGSESTFNPLSLFINGGCDILQTYQSPSRVDEFPWRLGATSVWRSVTSPLYYINEYGWERFLTQEVLPGSLDIEKAQYIPNYFLHVVGGGMDYRKISEWYDYHGYPLPAVLGAVTAMSFHYLNELIENGDGIHPNTDAIADLMIFDPLGILLFSFDNVAGFFSSELSLNDWSPQAALSFRPLSVRNFGQSYVMKYPLTSNRSTSVFFHFGKFALFGLSIKTNHKESISVGLGATTTGVYIVDQEKGIPTRSTLVGAMGGIYYDRNNSLLASFTVTDKFIERFKLNVYPGALFDSAFSPGVFVALEEQGTFGMGVIFPLIPLGVSFYSPK